MTIVAEKTNNAFQLKGSLFSITVLQLFTSDKMAFETQLKQTLEQAPKFFENAPIVIDFNEFDSIKTPLDFANIMTVMREAKLVPFGIRGGDLDIQQQALNAGLAILHNSPHASHITKSVTKKSNNPKKNQATAEINPPEKENGNSMVHTKIITQPVRSGQQIYAKNSDLIILSSVSHGAEILADGHIHVYGPLRGRALAGIMGNAEARIFCHALEAELISIAGRYLVSDQLDIYKDKQHLNIYLEGEQIKVSSI